MVHITKTKAMIVAITLVMGVRVVLCQSCPVLSYPEPLNTTAPSDGHMLQQYGYFAYGAYHHKEDATPDADLLIPFGSTGLWYRQGDGFPIYKTPNLPSARRLDSTVAWLKLKADSSSKTL